MPQRQTQAAEDELVQYLLANILSSGDFEDIIEKVRCVAVSREGGGATVHIPSV